MSISITVLELYKDISSGTTDATQTYTPPTGDFTICEIEGEAAFDINCAVEIKFDGALVWMTKGSSKRLAPIELVGDGVKKVELVLDAEDLPSGSVYLGGYLKIKRET